ncbi:cytochrome c oxidase assembly protein [Rothia sp. ZJ932]|uniref:cytochrome c oxidase assembly protein n=1 Tax=Rothia sp. ZJ932 TaxID=2810516 RepID=UPI001F087C83|nr:cytochrome c oxidase assembly protein [Rothia sp. ZJ932]
MKQLSGTVRGIAPHWIWVFPAVALMLMVASFILTGANAGTELADAGPTVRWLLPVVEVFQNTALATLIGSLLFAIGIVPRFTDDTVGKAHYNMAHTYTKDQRIANLKREQYPAFSAIMNLASASSVVWALTSIAQLVLAYAEISGRAVNTSETYTEELASYITTITAGQAQAFTVGVALVVSSLTFAVRSLTSLLLTLALSLLGIVTLALTGHSSGGDDHMGAVNSLGLHVLGMSLWTGGLITLAYISRTISRADAGTGTVAGRRDSTLASRRVSMVVAVLKRYSTVALFSFVLLLASGVINASLRMNSWADLTSNYGMQVVLKLALTVMLGAIGVAHRVRLIPAMESGKTSGIRGLWQAIIAELIIMGAASGLAVALSRTAPPKSDELPVDATPVRIITNYEMPPEPHVIEWFTQWRLDWFWVSIIAFLAFVYVWAYTRVRALGGKRSPLRLASWLVGLTLLFYATSGGLAVYSQVLFSAHMVEHMSLTMIVPTFLVLGAPVTLLLTALQPRQDGTRGPREWILRLVHSTWSKVITNPLFAGFNFAGSLVLMYFTPMFGISMRYHVGHEFMLVHFLLTGYLFVLVLIGIDPIPYRPIYPFRLLLLIATLGYHAFIGIAIMHGNSLLLASWFGNLGRPWGGSALEDQQLGGAIMWGMGEIPTMLVAVIVAIQWASSDTKLTKRLDRQADRDNDAELKAYNAMFEELNDADARR